MDTGKKIDKSAHIGDAGIALIHRAVNRMGHAWHDRTIDAGIDGTIELRDPATGVMSNNHLMVQSKASNLPFPGEDARGFHYLCKTTDLDYWMKADQPVLLICSHPDTDEAWWVHVQAWFADPARRASGRVDFDKATQSFTRDISGRLFAVADPHGQAHTPVADHIHETLVSNLLPVEIPDVYYSAPVSTSRKADVYETQRKTKHPYRHDFVLSRGRIYTWEPTAGTSLAMVGDAAANTNPTAELANGNDDDQRLLVWMLNAALRHDLRHDCGWHRRRNIVYFYATTDLKERKVRSESGRTRLVFKGYPQKLDPTKMGFYKHSALDWRFTQAEGDWYCELKPDYFYSYDGKQESKYTPEYLRKIKARERNNAVLGETLMWANFLRGEETLIPSEPRILDFGSLLTFAVDRGLDDREWRAPTAEETSPADQMSLFEVN